MDYQRIYNELIEARRSTPVPEGYTEQHHIIPRAFQGTNDADNLIALTPEDHFMCHRLLAKIHGGPMNIAIWRMSQVNGDSARGVYISPRVYAEARKNFVRAISGSNSPMYGKPKSEETKQKLREANLGKIMSDDTRAKMSAAQRGSNHPMYGKHPSAESLRKMSKAQSGKNNPMYGKPAPNRSEQKYIFQHDEHGKQICTVYSLRTEFGLHKSHLSSVVLGKRKSHQGWRCLGIAE